MFKLNIGDSFHLNIGGYDLLIQGTAVGTLRRWNGSAWVQAPAMQYYNGSTFVTKPLKRWNGSTWETINVV